MAAYTSFRELKRREVEGRDYRIRSRRGWTGILLMAPHGGGIEPGTSRIADAAAGDEHAFYAFEGLKARGNSRLHVTSALFDEPVGLRMAAKADTVLTVHGCKDRRSVVLVGGLNRRLGASVWKALERAGFLLERSSRIAGENPGNICNRCRSGEGVQVEISAGLRRRMFDLRDGREGVPTPLFDRFVRALRGVLADP
jgi:phage replication-related protein YjqB (UPF0714/DUF867 family)